MKYRNLNNSFGLNRREQARLARAKRKSALPIGPLRRDVSPLNTFMDNRGKEGQRKQSRLNKKEIGRINLTDTRKLLGTRRPLHRLNMLIMVLVLLLGFGVAQAEGQKETIKWQANWIWYKGEQSPRNFYLYVRKEVEISAPVERAEFNCTADSRYQLFINGKLIGRGPARSDPRWQSYDKYEVSPYLHPGKNVIAVLIHHYGVGTSSYIPGRGAFLFQGEIICTNGDTLSILSDDTWKVQTSTAWHRDVPRISSSLGFQEIYDARLAPENWTEEDFDDSEWIFAMVIGRPPMAPWTSLVSRDIPMLLEKSVFPQAILGIGECQSTEDRWREVSSIAELMAEEVREPLDTAQMENIEAVLSDDDQYALINSSGKDVYLVLDFGREVVGYPYLRVEGPAGIIIDLGYSEVLGDGEVHPNRKKVKCVDRYTTRDGLQTWETFSKRGFRYMQVDIHNEFSEPLKIYSIGLNFSTYPVEYRGAFNSSDELLNQIWSVGRYTLQLCMQDTYEDCPFREQALWMGDARVEALVNYYTFGDTKLIARSLRLIGQSQLPEGITRGAYPMRGSNKIADYCLLWIISLWDYYQYSGDRDLVEELYPRIKNALAFFQSHLDQYNLLSDVPGWTFIDWADLDERGEITTLNCFYYKALLDASQMAQLLGEEDEVVQYQRLATEVKAAINSRLWWDEAGVYVDCRVGDVLSKTVSQHANSLAIIYDIAGVDRQERIYSYLFAKHKSVVQPQTPYFMFYVLRSLFHTGRYQKAIETIRWRWGDMLKKGATTFWEVFGTWTGSRCHGWSAGPTMLLPAEILGIQPVAPGFKVFRIKPHTVDLVWAKGTVPTPQGDISVSWQKSQEESDSETSFQLKVYIPEETTGEVFIPGLTNTNPTVSLNDLVFWSRDKVEMKPKGVKKVEREDNYLRVTLEEPGEYEFKVIQLSIIPIEGYGGARWKMSPEEVHQVFPDKDFSNLQHPWIARRSTAQDKLIDWFSFWDRIMEENAEINFYFFQNELFKVEVDIWGGEKQDYEVLKNLIKTKSGDSALGEQRRPGNCRLVRWKDENFNVIQLFFDPQAFFLPHLRLSYINGEINSTIEGIRQDQEK